MEMTTRMEIHHNCQTGVKGLMHLKSLAAGLKNCPARCPVMPAGIELKAAHNRLQRGPGQSNMSVSTSMLYLWNAALAHDLRLGEYIGHTF